MPRSSGSGCQSKSGIAGWYGDDDPFEPLESGAVTPADDGPDPAAPDAPALGARRAPTVNYKGEPLEAARGPGLGCFWIQAAVLGLFVILTPLSVAWDWPASVSAGLLIAVLVLLLFVGQTTIFLLRLVAADRRAGRRPLASATRTVGELDAEASRGSQDGPAAGQPPPEPRARCSSSSSTITSVASCPSRGGSAPCASPGDLLFRTTRP